MSPNDDMRLSAASADLILLSDASHAARLTHAMQDFRLGLGMWRLAWTLGWFDIRLRYRGSVLGPFWLTLSTAVMVGALGLLYSTLFKMDLREYLPFLALSLVLWNFLSALVSDACTCFTQSEGMIRSVRLPFALHAMRTLVRNVLVLGHNVVVILLVYALLGTWPGSAAALAAPAVLLWLIDGLACCLLLGSVCARFRDIPPIVGSVMQIAFFISPIIWRPDMLTGESARLLPLNPFFTLLDVVRGPLLGHAPGWHIWLSAVAYSAALCAVAWFVFARVRARLAFWV